MYMTKAEIIIRSPASPFREDRVELAMIYVINVGPQHPATHGVLHLVITFNGETIKKVEPHLGYIHRSIEKMCESLSLSPIYLCNQPDGLSFFAHQ